MSQPKILIVDDEMYLRRLIQQTLEELEDEGVTLLAAEDGEAALNLIRAEQPALVFLDVMLPRRSGFEVCETVKQQWGLRDIHIVLLTAKGQEFDKQRGLEAGADVYLTKPFDPDALLAQARAFLAK